MTDSKLDLEITRVLKAPRAKVWRAWSDPEILKQWWCPRPWQTEVRAFDFRSGGAFHTYMSGPDGGESDNRQHRLIAGDIAEVEHGRE